MSKCCKDCKFCHWRDALAYGTKERYICMACPPVFIHNNPDYVENWVYPVVHQDSPVCQYFKEKEQA